ncbi:G-protein coupled receptor Mth2-like isoform X2 [Leptidea sinapis]|uniref:G-protein coupled receptor Mth2-like isoform X2 n=1 Tax=Leptidea sinapis TaxID=189913 RepID=UPI00213D82C7|nr:G-protein coupled receptor Mth2-like isoform X2 [Leptidea sinapis]
MLQLCIILTLLSCVLCKKCNTSIDISEGVRDTDGGIFFEDRHYEENEHYFDNETNTERGCICLKTACIFKCCPFGMKYDSIQRQCVTDTDEFNPIVFDAYKRILNEKAKDIFHFNFGRAKCENDEVSIRIGELTAVHNLRLDGKLYIELPTSIPPWVVRGPDKYCIDTFVVEDDKGNVKTSLDALVCFADEPDNDRYMLSSTCMLISCVFIIATVAVYCWLPELRNLHGRVLIAYLLCLLVGFVFMSSMQILLNMDNITQNGCLVLTFFSYFFLLSAFFWLNVMCFDIWWTFSGKRGISIERMSLRARFCAYALYAFGVPTALTVLLAALEFSNLPPHPLLPLIKEQGCFLYGKSKMLYFYGPILVLCVGNIVFFCLTAMKIAQIKKETSVLKSRESATHDSQSSDRRRLFLYVKLFIVMGINWILEIVSYLYPDLEILKFVDAYNVLIGLIIFIIFVCKKKILRMLKKRIKERFHRANAEFGDINMREGMRRNFRDYKQRSSVDTIRTAVDNDPNKVVTAGL